MFYLYNVKFKQKISSLLITLREINFFSEKTTFFKKGIRLKQVAYVNFSGFPSQPNLYFTSFLKRLYL